MRSAFPALVLLAAAGGSAQAAGLLIPEDKKLPPLAMVNHKVTIAIDDQVAITRVEQTFRNHTDRQLEATYVFPVPRGASVDKFTMWVDGKETGSRCGPAFRILDRNPRRAEPARPETDQRRIAGADRGSVSALLCLTGPSTPHTSNHIYFRTLCHVPVNRARRCATSTAISRRASSHGTALPR